MSSEPCVLGIVGVGMTAADLPWSLPLLYLWANSPAREVCVWRAACGRVWQARLAAPTYASWLGVWHPPSACKVSPSVLPSLCLSKGE